MDIKRYRQGDVFIQEAEKIPCKMTAANEAVLAYGENGVGKFIEISGGTATVRHEEHAPITLPPGKYFVLIQREYDPEAYRRQRKVSD